MENELTHVAMTQPRMFRQTDADGPRKRLINFCQHFRRRESITSMNRYTWVLTSLTDGGRFCAALFDDKFIRVDGPNGIHQTVRHLQNQKPNDVFTRLYVTYKIKNQMTYSPDCMSPTKSRAKSRIHQTVCHLQNQEPNHVFTRLYVASKIKSQITYSPDGMSPTKSRA
ncbi:hypothetical protein DPMN_011057 [Dreissena polymorpha]|uniref:Uncharacterized protein n=1 Tax=Dreissena polymorpha TaxID=45954 RepID=A0A9D4N4B0_DREPO|nr:hypothetical protein DPMN_011057 [Dreissena polymorpha]